MSELRGSEFGRGSEVGGAGDEQEGKAGKGGGQATEGGDHPRPTQYLSRGAIRAIQRYWEGESLEGDQEKQ